MREVWKFKVPFYHTSSINVPLGAKPLAVQMQDARPVIWMEVKTDLMPSTENRYFTWYGTGNPLPENGEYIGTLQDGWLVWHLYEMKG